MLAISQVRHFKITPSGVSNNRRIFHVLPAIDKQNTVVRLYCHLLGIRPLPAYVISNYHHAALLVPLSSSETLSPSSSSPSYHCICHAFFKDWRGHLKFIIIITIITTITIISFMQGIYTHIPETNYVPKEYSVAAILLFLFMVLISLVSVLNLLNFYISTFRSMCAVPNMAVFCSSLTSLLLLLFVIIFIRMFTIAYLKQNNILVYIVLVLLSLLLFILYTRYFQLYT